jgi:hypothetical protein
MEERVYSKNEELDPRTSNVKQANAMANQNTNANLGRIGAFCQASKFRGSHGLNQCMTS